MLSSVRTLLAKPIAVNVDLPDGPMKLHFREPSAIAVMQFRRGYEAGGEEATRAMLSLIAASWCHADGKPVVTPEEAEGLTLEVATALLGAIPLKGRK